MKVTLNSTTKIVTVDNVPARVWEGETDSGIPVFALITRIATDAPDTTEFERELAACRVPSPAIRAIDARLVL